MNRNLSIAISAVIVIALGLAVFFLQKPLVNNLDLGLDLRGGLRVVLQAQEKPGEPITDDTIQKAVGIIRDRVDSYPRPSL